MSAEQPEPPEAPSLRDLIESAFRAAYRCAMFGNGPSLHQAWAQFQKENGLENTGQELSNTP